MNTDEIQKENMQNTRNEGKYVWEWPDKRWARMTGKQKTNVY